MRIYTKAGDLSFDLSVFPDGQPHFKLNTVEKDFSEATIEVAITDCQILLQTLMAKEVLNHLGYMVNLDIRYLLGARMDRAINYYQPFTLQLIAKMINSAGFARVRILDVHSESAIRQIKGSINILPYAVVNKVLSTLGPDVVPVCPDSGAERRVHDLVRLYDRNKSYVSCGKSRDPETGMLSGFEVKDPTQVKDQDVVIIDDICDGGGTFQGLAVKLKEAGAKKIYLYVTHGIFSKGLPLDGIDLVFTTDSYDDCPYDGLVILPVSMKDIGAGY